MTSIPHIIHYIWVGGTPLPALARHCIASWKIHLPDWQIICWNEDNFPDTEHPYYQAMYQQQKWAFVSDYMRFKILEEFGGIYFDTDQELLRDCAPLLDNDSIWGYNKEGSIVTPFIAATAHNDFIRQILARYDTLEYSTKQTSPRVVSEMYQEYAAKEQITIHPSTYTCPLDAAEYPTPAKLANAYMTHHWAESWVPFARCRKIVRNVLARVGLLPLVRALRRSLNPKTS